MSRVGPHRVLCGLTLRLLLLLLVMVLLLLVVVMLGHQGSCLGLMDRGLIGSHSRRDRIWGIAEA